MVSHLNYADQLTGVPYTFVPNPELPPRSESKDAEHNLVADMHHPGYPEDFLVGHGISAEAVRYARVQWVMRQEHESLHREGIVAEMPHTDRGRFVMVAAEVAKFIPKMGLEFHPIDGRLKPSVRIITHAERRQMWATGQIRVDAFPKVRRFMASYVINTGLADLPRTDWRLRDEYLADPMEHKLEMLTALIRLTLRETGFGDIHRQLKKKGLIPAHMGATGEAFVLRTLLPVTIQQKPYPQAEAEVDDMLYGAIHANAA